MAARLKDDMLSLLLAAAVATPTSAWANPAYSILDDSGFSVKALKRLADGGSSVALHGETFPNVDRDEKLGVIIRILHPGRMDSLWEDIVGGFAGPVDLTRYAPSGYPLGQHLYFEVGGVGSSHLDAISDDVYLKLHTRRGLVRQVNGSMTPKSGWGTAEARMFEVVARWLTAEYAGRTMMSKAVVVDGTSMPGLRTRSGNNLVSLPSWAQAKGKAYRINEQTAMAAVGSGAGEIIVPLGSPKIKVGSQMRSLSTIVVVKDGAPYVDASVLASL